MENINKSPSEHIYSIYKDYEKRGMNTADISRAIQRATGTEGMSSIEAVTKWLNEMDSSSSAATF